MPRSSVPLCGSLLAPDAILLTVDPKVVDIHTVRDLGRGLVQTSIY